MPTEAARVELPWPLSAEKPSRGAPPTQARCVSALYFHLQEHCELL